MDTYDKLDIADEMLDAAITEFLNHQRFLPALNLAAVAEELYGKYIRISKGEDVLHENIKNAGLIAKHFGAEEIPHKDWKKVANTFKNEIKHFDSEADRFVEIDAEDEARLAIWDALQNHDKLNRAESEEIAAFTAYAHEYAKKRKHIDS